MYILLLPAGPPNEALDNAHLWRNITGSSYCWCGCVSVLAVGEEWAWAGRNTEALGFLRLFVVDVFVTKVRMFPFFFFLTVIERSQVKKERRNRQTKRGERTSVSLSSPPSLQSRCCPLGDMGTTPSSYEGNEWENKVTAIVGSDTHPGTSASIPNWSLHFFFSPNTAYPLFMKDRSWLALQHSVFTCVWDGTHRFSCNFGFIGWSFLALVCFPVHLVILEEKLFQNLVIRITLSPIGCYLWVDLKPGCCLRNPWIKTYVSGLVLQPFM